MMIILKKRRTFVPKTGGNDNLPPEEQVSVSYDKPSVVDRSLWQKVLAVRRHDGSSGAYYDTDMKAILEGSKVIITNLQVDDGEAKRFIKTGADLAREDSGILWLLASEIVDNVMRLDIPEELGKNSASPSRPASGDTTRKKRTS